jgi:hypothetical protein
MSYSEHPRALSLERWVSSATRLLIVVMCLPLIDGVFAAVVLAGTLNSVGGIIEVGLLIFSGSATIAVILAEMDQTPRQQARIVLAVGAVVITGAAVQAALAPTVETALDMETFKRVAALVILAVAATTASARVGEYLPGPMAIVALGLVISASPSEATLAVQTDPALIARAIAAASVGVGTALVVAVASPWLRAVVDIDRFRFGSAVALGVLALSVVGIIPTDAPVALAVLAVTAVLAFNPESEQADSAAGDPPEDDGQEAGPQQPVSATDGSPSAETQAETAKTDPDTGTDRSPWM